MRGPPLCDKDRSAAATAHTRPAASCSKRRSAGMQLVLASLHSGSLLRISYGMVCSVTTRVWPSVSARLASPLHLLRQM